MPVCETFEAGCQCFHWFPHVICVLQLFYPKAPIKNMSFDLYTLQAFGVSKHFQFASLLYTAAEKSLAVKRKTLLDVMRHCNIWKF